MLRHSAFRLSGFCTFVALTLLASVAGPSPARATTLNTSALSLVTNSSGQATALTNLLTGTQWLPATTSLYTLSADAGVTASLTFQPLTNGELQLTLTLTNPTASTLTATPTFPTLSGISPGASYGNLGYCFPQMGIAPSTNVTSLNKYYGGGFPLQFIDVYSPMAGGIYIMTHDLSDLPKTYYISKSANNTVTSRVTYGSQAIAAGGSWVLTAVIGAHAGDWHDALTAYKAWVKTWYAPLTPRKTWFQDVYNLREMFLYTNTAIGATPAYNPTTQTYIFNTLLAQDTAAFGGVDYVHLFDWSQTPTYGRVGDYNPWSYLGGTAAFSNQVAQMQAAGSPVGLYFEGYLIAKSSLVAQANGTNWQLTDVNGDTYENFGSDADYMCPFVPGWTNYLTGRCVQAIQNCAANGVYLDEYGFGWQYPCYESSHPHSVPSNQLQGEAAMVQQLRHSLPPTTALYTEERSTDIGSQYQDGSFTTAISQSDTNQNPSQVNLARFALPDFKVFEILSEDKPAGNDVVAVGSVFFNGEGIWLEGPLNDAWFPATVCQLITKTHALLRGYADAFRSANPTPLVPTLNGNIYANQFPGDGRTVWTLFNGSSEPISGEVLAVTAVTNASYYDAWNGTVLTPRIAGNLAYLTVTVPAYGLGCVVQTTVTIAPTILTAPQSQTMLLGQTESLTTQAGGTSPLNYQWQFAGTNLVGQTGSSLTLSNVQTSMSGAYQVIVSNGGGAITSRVAVINVITRNGLYSSMVQTDGAAGYWRLDETATAGSVATNWGSVGSAANGTYAAGVTGNQAGAVFGDTDAAASFNGTSGLMQAPYNAGLNSNVFTIECWANPALAAPGNYMTAMNARVTSPQAGYTFYIAPGSGQWQFWTGNGSGWNVQTGPVATANQWTYLVGTYDGHNQCFYVNGTLVASNAETYVRNTSGPLQVGAGGSATSSAYFFNGSLDEVAIYNRVLPAATMQAHYSVGLGLWLNIENSMGAVQLNWNGGTLQQAGQLNSSWTNTNLTPPLNLGASPTGAMFYRVMH